MTIKHIAMALDAEGLDGPEKLLLIAYCDRTDDHGYCWPGHLADGCGTSIAKVKRVKAKLIKKKLIVCQQGPQPSSGPHQDDEPAPTELYQTAVQPLRERLCPPEPRPRQRRA
ncbi:hypothetical protein SHKM778_47840 [Streptomyces sp. KM77-8]|uniref:Helix-turn-helix domain-containing protein n=1 Tax=Streptomyces haneummycinicus TaxID=3074435 RepID=A0AAT9HM43_9ACTN